MDQLPNEQKQRVVFTKKMKKDYTILTPMMLPIHFALLQSIFRDAGYHLKVLDTQNLQIIEKGLRYSHNDICYPAQLVIGQLLDALDSGQYDLNKVAVMMTQTGGGCRASNYVNLLRKALAKAGLAHIPVVSLNFSGLEKNPGFKITMPMFRQLIYGSIYGDLIMWLRNQTLPYEKNVGQTELLVNHFVEKLSKDFHNGLGFSKKHFQRQCDDIVQAFAQLPLVAVDRVKVGVVGEIYIKFAPLGNNNLEAFLVNEQAEVVVPGLLDFILYTVDTVIEDYRLYGIGAIKQRVYQWIKQWLMSVQNQMIHSIKQYSEFRAPSSFEHVKSLAKDYIGYGAKMGEGWLLTAEMLELIDQGINNVVCTQPFGCLPNHVCGRGMIRKIKDHHTLANIVAIDYDASATRVNQENRLKLMLSTAKNMI